MQSKISRRVIIGAGLAVEYSLALLPATRAIGMVMDQASPEAELDRALKNGDQSLFPSHPIAFLGAVLGGLVGFAITNNPVIILAELVGGTIVGGVERAAERYLADRSKSYGGYQEAIQNATAGDLRADSRRTEQHRSLIEDRAGDVSGRITRLEEVVGRLTSEFVGRDLTDQARDAATELWKVTADLKAENAKLAGYTSKHRDMVVVYAVIGDGCGIAKDTGFTEQMNQITSKTGRLQQSLPLDDARLDRAGRLLSEAQKPRVR